MTATVVMFPAKSVAQCDPNQRERKASSLEPPSCLSWLWATVSAAGARFALGVFPWTVLVGGVG